MLHNGALKVAPDIHLLRVQVTQVGDVLRALGQNPTEGDVKKLVQSTNSKGGPDARVTFETFLPLLQVPKLSKVFSGES